MMEETDVRAPALERHLQSLEGHVPVVHRADGPPHDEPREQIQDRREVQFAAAADDELGRVADPPLIRGVRLELAVEQIRRDRLVVIAHGGYFVTLPGPCDQAFFLHQPDDPFATHLLVLLDQVFVNARAAIALFARVKGRLDEDLQPPVVS